MIGLLLRVNKTEGFHQPQPELARLSLHLVAADKRTMDSRISVSVEVTNDPALLAALRDLSVPGQLLEFRLVPPPDAPEA